MPSERSLRRPAGGGRNRPGSPPGRALAVLGLLALMPRPAAAYMAPFSLNLFLQIVVGVGAALVVVLILYGPKLWSLLGIGRSGDDPAGTGDSDER